MTPLETLLDYVQRSTHWQEGGATRDDALLALGGLGADVPAPYLPQYFDACPTCGEDGGTSCGVPNCGLLVGPDDDQFPRTERV